jgi:antitoxin MazE
LAEILDLMVKFGYTTYIQSRECFIKDNNSMTTAIVKWGNSQGIRLPKTLLQNINISEMDTVDVIVENEAIIIKKTYGKKHKTTKERLANFYGSIEEENITGRQEEIDWGKPVGKELW